MPRFRDGLAEEALARGGVAVLAMVLALASASSFVRATQQVPVRVLGLALTLVCIASFLGVQLGLIRQRWSGALQLLAVLCAASSVVLFVALGAWHTLGMGIAALGLGFPAARVAVPTLLVATGCHLSLLIRLPGEYQSHIGIPTVNWISAIVLYSMTRLVVVLQELRRTREHLARLQVDEERSRISRDLHDIIGRTLVAVSLRTETAMRLIDVDVAKCRLQLEQLQSSISTGQSQLRALTSGPVITGLASELDTAQRLFDRLGVRIWVETVPVDDLGVEHVLAAVVRESVTNCLKHSRPQECRIVVRRESLATVLSVVNDGLLPARRDPDAAPEGTRDTGVGTGLQDMRVRVETLGGTLTAGPVEGHRFRVIVRIPHPDTGRAETGQTT